MMSVFEAAWVIARRDFVATVYSRSFIRFDCGLRAADVCPVARRIPAHRQGVDEYVRFLPQIENRHRAARSRQHKFEALRSKLTAARRTQIAQADSHRHLALTQLR
jgi:hypothetical protein